MCVPPWPVPWATWHSAELNHATRVASHRARAQSTQSSPPAADGDWSTRPAFFDISSCCGPCHATPDGWAHRGACGACAKLLFSSIASEGREEIAKKEPLVGGSVSRLTRSVRSLTLSDVYDGGRRSKWQLSVRALCLSCVGLGSVPFGPGLSV